MNLDSNGNQWISMSNGGDDYINGGAGADLIYTGSGSDTIDYSFLEDSTIDASDEIMDFEQGEGKIQLASEIANSIDDLSISNDGNNTYINDIDSDFSISINGLIDINENDFIFG